MKKNGIRERRRRKGEGNKGRKGSWEMVGFPSRAVVELGLPQPACLRGSLCCFHHAGCSLAGTRGTLPLGSRDDSCCLWFQGQHPVWVTSPPSLLGPKGFPRIHSFQCCNQQSPKQAEMSWSPQATWGGAPHWMGHQESFRNTYLLFWFCSLHCHLSFVGKISLGSLLILLSAQRSDTM